MAAGSLSTFEGVGEADHFALMGLPVAFSIDTATLEQGYRALQTRVHPDRFASAPPAERRAAMQWATRANEAYRTLRDPVDRARYLLQLRGYDTEEETNTAMPPDFLMQQMEWRESVAVARTARGVPALDALHSAIGAEHEALLGQLGRALDADANYVAGCSLVRKLRFLEKITLEIDDAREALHGDPA